ncbi:MAG: hypothetical protein K2O52_07445 [Oscillospiraceae bacterium]|nr:hypothetical protein [Oscillospiraceae bacterium]
MQKIDNSLNIVISILTKLALVAMGLQTIIQIAQPVSQIEAENTQTFTEMLTETEKTDESDTENNAEVELATTEEVTETTEQEETAEPETTKIPTDSETTETEEVTQKTYFWIRN